MPTPNKLLFDKVLNEWLFDRLVNLTADQRSKLNATELNYLKNPSKVKAFIAHKNIEKILSITTKVGIEWALNFFETKRSVAEGMKRAYKQYSFKDKAVEAIEKQFGDGVFVVHSRDMAIAQSIMSLNSHSDVFLINPAFFLFKRDLESMKEAGDLAKRWSETNIAVKQDDVLRGTQNFAKLFLEMGRMDDYLQSQFGLTMCDVMILQFLYSQPYNYVSVDLVKRTLKGKYTPGTVGQACFKLFRHRQMIDKRPSSESVPSYIIMQQGIQVIGMVNNYLLNKTYHQ